VSRKRLNWSRPLPRRLILPDLPMTLRTLVDVRTLLGHLPAHSVAVQDEGRGSNFFKSKQWWA